jgi:hypothetical protein
MSHLPLRTLSAAALALALLGGCESSTSTSSGKPSVSGRTVVPGGTRTVSRGEDVVIRIPAADSGKTKWRLTEFDSRMLRLTQRARLDRTNDGRLEWTFRFEARTVGTTEIVLQRTAASSGDVGERRRITIRIR